MAAVWWFLAGKTRQDLVLQDELRPAALREVGLDKVLADVRKVPDQCLLSETQAGPSGGPGIVLYPIPVSNDLPKKPGYDPTRQTWRQSGSPIDRGANAAPLAWLGYATDEPPAPADLERRVLIGGYPIEDAHGQTWHVPALRCVDNPRGRLSVAFTWDEHDRPQIGVDARYAELWQQSARVWDLIDHRSSETGGMFAQDFDAGTDAFLLEYLLDCLQLNYRVNNAVFRAIDAARPGWLSQAAASWMLNATVDLFKYRQFLAAQKKTPS